jgi:pimeloyl-ACP methyl ester carboxylesterase
MVIAVIDWSPGLEPAAAPPPRGAFLASLAMKTRPPKILARGPAPSIAYRALAGRAPTVVFLTGLRSDMQGGKALALEAHCRRRGRAFVRFDYRGHGASAGRFVDGTVGAWRDDAVAVVDRVAKGPVVLVGSSLGGWIMVLAALARPRRVAGLVGVAAASDFTERLIWKELDAEARALLAREGVFYEPSAYSPEPTPITAALIEDGRRHLVLDHAIPFAGPVRLIHGTADPDVPWALSVDLAGRIESRDVAVTLVKDGDHRLSGAADLARLCRQVEEVAALVEGGLSTAPGRRGNRGRRAKRRARA